MRTSAIKISDLPARYQQQAQRQLDALATGGATRKPKQDTGATLEHQGRYPALLAYPVGPVLVRIIRIGGRRLDGDNLDGGCKELRDAIAAALGRSGDSEADGMRWQYDQQPGGAEIGTRVEITEG